MNSTAEINMIAALNLDAIKAALMDKESGDGWSQHRATAVEFEYRRFLCLMKLFPDEQVAPLVDVDTFWHRHILDTRKYAADCAQVFGYFLHHVPSSGERGDDEEAVHQRTGERMQELYEATFGEAYIRPQAGSAGTMAGPESAWCAPATPKAAWCAPESAKAAWCAPGSAETAWCAPASAKAAWCAPATPTAAWCAPASPGTAWLRGARALLQAPCAAAENAPTYSLQMPARLA